MLPSYKRASQVPSCQPGNARTLPKGEGREEKGPVKQAHMHTQSWAHQGLALHLLKNVTWPVAGPPKLTAQVSGWKPQGGWALWAPPPGQAWMAAGHQVKAPGQSWAECAYLLLSSSPAKGHTTAKPG